MPAGRVGVAFTSRPGGLSEGPFSGLNLALHTGDNPVHVRANRQKVSAALGLDSRWAVPRQVHGCRAVAVSALELGMEKEADAVTADVPGVPAAVMVADCIPIALVGEERSTVAHAGWRGLCSGVIEQAVHSNGGRDLEAWIGPCIGPCHFEVGQDVVDAFSNAYPAAPAFWDQRVGRLHFNLPAAARWVLGRAGVYVADGDDPPCTFCNSNLYSFRRDGVTGRQAVLVWR